MAKLFRAIVTTASLALLHFCLGCGAGLVPVNTTPSISQVVPQTIAAGTKNLTIKVSGSNFTSESVILWNGSALSTSVIDSNTLSSPLASNIVAIPSTAQLQVQDTVTKASSTSVPVVITTPATGASASTLTLSTTSLPQPALGTPYSVALTANGGTPAYIWSVTGGQLPSGLTLSSTGVLSGAPTSSGSFSFTITVADSSSPVQTAAMQFGLTISVPPPVTTPPPPVTTPPPPNTPVSPTPLQITPSLPAGAVGSMYSGSLQVSGGTAPYTWSSSALPAGLNLGSNGAISGDPTSSGSTTVTFTVADSSSPALTASVAATLVVAPSPLAITIVSLPAAQTNSPYSASLQVRGGTAPYTWSATSLPTGLALANNGTISGTPTASGNFPITVTVTDAGSPTLTTKTTFTLSVTATVQPLIITSTSLAPATSSKPYSASLDASGGTAPYLWSAGALPSGLTLASNGIISGTPTATGNFPITVTLADAGSPSQSTKASFTLSVTAAIQPLTITSAVLAGATSNQPYSASLNAAGGTAPYTWSASALPAGLLLASDGILSGTPTATGTFPVIFTVTDAGAPALTAKATLTLSITADIQPLTITSTALASATSNKPYSASLDASGGTAPYTWSSTALPAGLTLRSNGIIAGTPTTTGTLPITFTVTDAGSPALTAKTTLSISVTAAIQPLTITSTAFAGAISNQPYSASLNASGGTAPYLWSATGLPAGLSLASNGIIAGTPTATGNFPITVNVTDSSAPAATAKATFSLSVTAPIQPLTITSTAFTGATSNQPYAASLNASGGTSPYIWSATGLPAGLSLASNGIIAGTPTAAGSFPITFTVTDAGSPTLTTKATLTLSVAAAIQPLTITSTAFAGATANQPYSASLNASGGTAPYTWSAAGLPAGLSLSGNGIIAGTPTTTGTFPIAVTVSDSQNPTKTASATISLSVAAAIAPLAITSTAFAGATSTQSYSTTLSATGGTAPYTWSVTGLPAGLTLGSNGVIAGTPTATGSFPISITVTDAGSPALTAKATLTLSITAPIAPLSITSPTFAGATSNKPYSTTLSATGGTAPYTWSVAGLPAGLSLGANGVITGTPTATGNFSVTVTVTDSQSPAKTASATITLSVTAAIAPLSITSTAFAGSTSTQPYSTTLSATGGTAPYTWSVTGLPTGLTLGGNGIIAGTPTATGSFPITITVTDAGSPTLTAKATLTLSVTAPIAPLSITSTAFAGATSNKPYSTTLSATGGTAPYTWSVTGLPAGLTLGGNGVIAGSPTATGNFPITITVTDSQSPAKTASATITLSVTAAVAPLSITSTAFAGATSTQPYSTTLSATGGTAPYTWSVTGLPTGLALGSNGVIAGAPTATGNFSVSVTVSDSQNPAKTASATIPLSVTAAIAPLSITSTAFAGATSTQAYSTTLSATGGTAPYNWSITGLPTGLTLGGNGVIAGTPTATGNFSVTVTVTDSQSPAKTASATIPLSVTAAIAPLSITSTTFAGATSTQPYSATLSATGGTAPYTWSVTGLPTGLSLGANGVVAGTPTATGNFSITVTVSDSQSPAKTASATIPLSVTAAIAPLSITSTAFAGATSTQPYSATLSATGGTAPYTWSVTGLPTGLTLGGNGVIAGTPTATGNFSITVTVSDSQSPAKTASATISLSVTAAIAPLSITSTAFAGATSTQPYSTTLSATGGTAPYTWSVTGLPTGLSLGGNGVIAGTPTATGNFSVSVIVSDSQNPAKTASATIPLSVTTAIAPLSITSTTFAAATSTQPYSATLSATGGTAPYTWSVTGLPAGLTLGGNGVIAGTPTATGNFSVSVTVSDSQNPAKTASATISLAVAVPPLTITSSTLPSGRDGTTYSGTLQASGGTPAYTWSISGSLPAGLTLAATTGVISGTPTVTGTSSFTATVSDNGNPVQTKSVTVSITLSAALPPPGPGTTWYVRPDGGTNTQCTGKTNAAYPGSGTGQACAFNHPYQMLNYSGNWANMVGGDTLQFVNTSGTSDTYYMGEQNSGVGTDWHAQLGGVCSSPNQGNGAGSSCILPTLPSGTSGQHTRILGQNAGNCHDSAHTHLVNPTVLSGIDNAWAVLDTRGTEYVDISCIEVTQPDTCTTVSGKGQCTDANNFVHYGGIILNYETEQGPSNLTLQDFAVVGVGGAGILGSHLNKTSSDVFSATDVYVIGNGSAGWNGDGGGCGTSCETVGTMNLSHVMVDWNGCVAVKPYDMTKPDTQNAFNYCYGQESGGYGDGFVQIAAGNMTMNVDHSYFRWNTQDGFDSLHLSDDNTTSPAIHISTSWSEGNAGQTFKLGAGAASSAINNVSISNCRILSNASAFPLNPSGWALDGADTCRAAGDEWAFQMNNGTTITLEYNTSVGYGTTMFDVGCAYLAPNCVANGATFIYRNNIAKGYPDPGNSNKLASGFYFGAGNVFANAGSAIDHNMWSTMNTGCPDSYITTEKIYTCGDPDMVGETDINNINPNITSSSPAINSGIAISGITTDFNGATRANPPAIGAMEP